MSTDSTVSGGGGGEGSGAGGGEEESSLANFGNQAKSWIEDDMNFITIMIIVASVLAVFGLFLIIWLCRYPSYDYPEKFERDQRLRGRRRGKGEGMEEEKIGSVR